MNPIPLSLYVHWPWCLKKCPYCDFNSHGLKGEAPELRYLDGILRSLEEQIDFSAGRPVQSIFFGGGTPSLMRPETVEAIIDRVERFFGLAHAAEITLESNPGTLEFAKFKDFRAAGINRLSLGIQSFQDDKLKALGRVHNGREAREAAEGASRIFEHFNLDLMFGLPGQTLADVREEIHRLEGFRPTHASYYQLTIEPNTYFAKFSPQRLPSEDELSEMSEYIGERLGAAGFDHYEVSAYALSNEQCRHNLNYWQFGDYLAVGPGAHGKFTRIRPVAQQAAVGEIPAGPSGLETAEGEQGAFQTEVFRFRHYRDPARWLLSFHQNASPVVGVEKIVQEALPFEFMLNALRLRQGVPIDFWTQRTGLPLSRLEPIWTSLEKAGLAEPLSKRICTTDRGWSYLNEVLEAFL